VKRADFAAAVRLFWPRFDTKEIARLLQCGEGAVWNAMDEVRR
jgi:hypothetical protein